MSRRRAARARGDGGVTLVELLVAIALLGIGVVAIMAALATSARAGANSRGLALTRTALSSAADVLAGPSTPFVACATPAQYQTALPAPPGGVTVTVQTVRHWAGPGGANGGTAFQATCPPAGIGANLQEITLRASLGTQQQTITVLKRG